jgi:DNA-directed RNA polymerase specialized sigma24 family protein
MTMHIHWTYDGCDEQDEYRIEDYWRNRNLELESKIAALDDEPTELRIAICQGEDPVLWEVQAALHVDTRTLAATSTSSKIERALDKVLHILAEKLDRLDEESTVAAPDKETSRDVIPLLRQARQSGQSKAFLFHLVPLVSSVQPYVRRELHVHQIEDDLPSEQITVADVLNEVIVRAWEQFPRRPETRPIELWLVGLVDEVLAQPDRLVVNESLDEPEEAATGEIREAWRDEWIERIDDETISAAELLPGVASVDDWDGYAADGKHLKLAEMLAQLPRDRRQAFILHAANGFGADEIGDFQGRSAEVVVADIALAKQAIERHLKESELDEIEESLERPSRPPRNSR